MTGGTASTAGGFADTLSVRPWLLPKRLGNGFSSCVGDGFTRDPKVFGRNPWPNRGIYHGFIWGDLQSLYGGMYRDYISGDLPWVYIRVADFETNP